MESFGAPLSVWIKKKNSSPGRQVLIPIALGPKVLVFHPSASWGQSSYHQGI